MVTRWVRWVVGVQFGRARLIVLLTFAVFLLLRWLFADQRTGWGFELVAVVLLVFGGRLPLPTALGEAAILTVAALEVGRVPSWLATMAGLALLELAIRRPLWQAAAGALALGAAYFVAGPDPEYGSPPLVNILSVDLLGGGVVVSLLLGAWLRLVLIRSKERRARDVGEARQAERIEIARELHDLVAHHVASMALRVGIAREVVPDLDPRVGAVLDDVHSSATTALADLRRLVGVLREPGKGGTGTRVVHVAPAALPAALTEVIDRGTRSGLKLEGHVDPAVGTLDSVRGLALLRLVQEGLTNVAKHAAGARATVRVDLAGGDVRVEVTDDGGVPDRQSPLPATESGYGLIGLRERVEVLGGTLTAGPLGGRRRGWRLRATLPVVAREPALEEA